MHWIEWTVTINKCLSMMPHEHIRVPLYWNCWQNFLLHSFKLETVDFHCHFLFSHCVATSFNVSHSFALCNHKYTLCNDVFFPCPAWPHYMNCMDLFSAFPLFLSSFLSRPKARPLLTFLQELKGEIANHSSLLSPSCAHCLLFPLM